MIEFEDDEIIQLLSRFIGIVCNIFWLMDLQLIYMFTVD